MVSLSTTLLLLLFLVGYSAPQEPDETFGLTLQELLRHQSEILQRLGDQERKLRDYQTMMETLQTKMETEQDMMETQQTIIQDLKSTMELSRSKITQDITTQHSALQHAIQDNIQEQYAGCTDIMPTVSNGDSPRVRPVDCMGHKTMGSTVSGVYEIYPSSCCYPISVWCDMDIDEGGWTVILSRHPQTEPENFSRNWEDYKVGFGNASTEYWIGNENMHKLTKGVPSILRIDAEDFSGTQRNGIWLEFSVRSLCSWYKLNIGQFQPNISTMGDDLTPYGDYELSFSTVDSDHDRITYNCASWQGRGAGWWYDGCSPASPTSVIDNTNSIRSSMAWSHWDPEDYGETSLRRMTMKFRPKDSQGPVRMCQ